MKMGKFQDLVEERFSKEKIAEMRKEVALEAEALRTMQKSSRVVAGSRKKR